MSGPEDGTHELRHAPGKVSAASQRPFGAFIDRRLRARTGELKDSLFKCYSAMAQASTVRGFIEAACRTRGFIDEKLDLWPELLGGRVTPFSTFRGAFLEEVTLRLAELTVRKSDAAQLFEVVKLGTGAGIITGVSLAFRRGRVNPRVPVVFRRDREDVVIGLRRTLVIANPRGAECEFPDELVPICFLACKVYVDATRLENVLAKARNVYAQYASCQFAVVSEWDALGRAWHDDAGRLLDSLVAPVEQMIFLRGDDARRPPNDGLMAASLEHRFQPSKLRALVSFLQTVVSKWE